MEIDEQRIQRQGYVNAFLQPTIVDAIQRGAVGKIAVTYVEWGGSAVQIVQDADRRPRHCGSVRGCPAPATDAADIVHVDLQHLGFFTKALFDQSDRGMRRVIDISGDGPNNAGAPAPVARNATVAQGIVIDGLPIMLARRDSASIPDLDVYYENCVIGGDGAFLLKVLEPADFAEAILKKLIVEILGPTVGELQRFDLLMKLIGDRTGYNCFVGEEMQELRIGQ